MKQQQIATSDFDIDGFLENMWSQYSQLCSDNIEHLKETAESLSIDYVTDDSLESLRDWGASSYISEVTSVDKPICSIYCQTVNDLKKMLLDGKRLFFPATFIEYKSKSRFEHGVEILEEITDDYGYLLEIKNGNIIVSTANKVGSVMCCVPPRLEICEDCGIYEKRLVSFVGTFINKKDF